MQLRYYQQEGADMMDEAFEEGHKIICLCMPTGAGKTVTFAFEALKYLQRGKTVMIVCNRRELIQQASNKIKNATGITPAIIDPNHKARLSTIYVASIDTLRNRNLPKADVVIIDEAHIRAFDGLALYYASQGAKVIGCTATPIRYGRAYLDGYPEYYGQMGDVYTKLITPVQTSELIREGFLVPEVCTAPKVDLSQLSKGTQDYTEKSLMATFSKPAMYKGAVEKYIQFAGGTKAVCFNINVEHSRRMVTEFLKYGIRAVHVDGKTPQKERDNIFKLFHEGYYDVLCNCGVATTGWDEPTAVTSIINRATSSLALWLQMTGRTARPCPEIGKTYHNIIDMGMNVFRHLPWSFDREWSLKEGVKKDSVSTASIKICDNIVNNYVCDTINYASARKCKECGYEFSVKSQSEYQEAEFEKIDLTLFEKVKKAPKVPIYKMTVQELEKTREERDAAIGWVVRQLMNRDPEELEQYAVLKGYSKSWIQYQNEKVIEPLRLEANTKLWDHIRTNLHLTEKDVIDAAYKMLSYTHSKKMIDLLIPRILEAKRSLHV